MSLLKDGNVHTASGAYGFGSFDCPICGDSFDLGNPYDRRMLRVGTVLRRACDRCVSWVVIMSKKEGPHGNYNGIHFYLFDYMGW